MIPIVIPVICSLKVYVNAYEVLLAGKSKWVHMVRRKYLVKKIAGMLKLHIYCSPSDMELPIGVARLHGKLAFWFADWLCTFIPQGSGLGLPIRKQLSM